MAINADVVTIKAQPEPIQIELGKTAVLVVDMQNDFGTVGGMFERAGIDISPIQQVVAPIGAVLAAARRTGMKVISLKMEHRPDLSDAGGPDSPHWRKHRPLAVGEPVPTPDGGESRILIRYTWNTAIVTELTPTDGDIVLARLPSVDAVVLMDAISPFSFPQSFAPKLRVQRRQSHPPRLTDRAARTLYFKLLGAALHRSG